MGAEKRALAWRTTRTVPSGVKVSTVVAAGGLACAACAAGAFCAEAGPPHRPARHNTPSILRKPAARISSPPVRSQTSLAILNIPVNNISFENADLMHAMHEWL
jgi:hypothetical protein